ncbi:MAG TPA: hypothetical protein VM010_01870 [Chitinophagaceae bacterium]|nr:hypothetical protein [Chitinophagaceae bacterium]
MNSKNQKPSSTNDLARYAGLGAQLFVSLGIAVFAGLKADQWLHLSFPLLVWVLPFVVLCVLIYKLIKDTSKQKNDNA